jgi:hypothetical protein
MIERWYEETWTNHAPYGMANCLTSRPSNKYNIRYA